MRKIQILAVLAFVVLSALPAWAQSEYSPSPFALTYYEFYGTPIAPLAYAQIDTDALGLNVLAEYNPSYYASFGLSYERTAFYDGFNSSASFLGLEARFFGAPNGKNPFAPYIYGGIGMGLDAGTGNEVKAGLGSRIQLAYPFFMDFSAGSNWMDSGVQFLTFRGGLSVSFDLPKVEASPTAQPTKASTPNTTVTPVGTLVDVFASPSPVLTATDTPTVEVIDHETVTVTATNTIIATATETVVETPNSTLSPVKRHYKLGMAAFEAHHYVTAVAEFKKALAIKDPSTQVYYFAESSTMLGVISQFYSKEKGHNDLAVRYYKRALKIDPMTKTAKKYLKTLQSGKPAAKAPTVKETKALSEDEQDAADAAAAEKAQSAQPAIKAASN